MLQQPLSLSFFISSLIFSLFSASIADSNVYVHCSQVSFNSPTPYQSNLDSLFTSLTDSASTRNFNKCQTTNSDVVYGLYQCRGDLTSPSCKDCVADAISQVKTTCPTSTGGAIQLDGCFVKYDNTSFFGAQDKSEVYQKCGPSIGYNSDVLNHIDSVLSYLVGGNGEYYRGGEFGGVQGVAQCVQDLSTTDCRECLSEAFRRLRSECETSTWGDMYLGKCFLRYADLGNHAGTSGETPSNEGNSRSGERNDGGSKKESLKWFGLIVAALVVMGLLIFAGNYFLDKKNRSKLMKAWKNLLEGLKKDIGSTLSAVKSVEKKVDKIEKEIEAMREQCKSTSRPPCPPPIVCPPKPVCQPPPCKPMCQPPSCKPSCQPTCRPPCQPPPCSHNPNGCQFL